MEKLHVCYTVNQTYLNPMLVSIYSLLENNPNLDISIYIIYENLSLKNQSLISQVVSNFSNYHLQMYDIAFAFPEIEKYQIPDWRGTKIANARLFLSKIIPNCPNSILYLDSDTIIVGDLNSIAKQKATTPIRAVLDHESKLYWQTLCPALTRYYNSGVLNIDYNLWEECNGYDRIIETINNAYSLTYPDQDILNIAFQNKIETLPLSYNLFPIDLYYDIFTLQKFYRNHQVEFYNKEDILKSRKTPIILHAMNFYGIRPWQENRIHPFQHLYLHYMTKIFGDFSLEECNISYANMNPQLFKFIEYLKFYTPKDIKKGLKRILRK